MIRILEWNSGFETADTRKTHKTIPWVRMNVLLADMRWAELWLERNAAEIWAGWTALIFCASQSEERGTVESVRKVAILSRVPEKMVQSGLEWALRNGMAEVSEDLRTLSGDLPETTPPTLRNVTRRTQRDETERDELGRAEEIYSAYPKKTAKQDAIRAIEKALRTVPASTLIEAVTAYAQATATWTPEEKRYIPNPATWFNDGRWDDDRATWASRSKTRNQTTLSMQFPPSYYEEQA